MTLAGLVTYAEHACPGARRHLVKGESRIPPAGADAVLRFIRDRVNVPRLAYKTAFSCSVALV